jgi:hypothetical protein
MRADRPPSAVRSPSPFLELGPDIGQVERSRPGNQEAFVHLSRAAAILTLSTVATATFTVAATAAALFCQGGGSMLIQNVPDLWVVSFERASEPANVADPGPGECAMNEVALPEGSATTLTISKGVKNALLLLAAAKGGTFQVEVTGHGGTLVVSSIGPVNVMDAEPLSEEEPADMEDDFADEGGMCGNGSATVVIPEPHLKQLNVRTRPGGKVIHKVPEGDSVTVVGPCGEEAAAGLAASKDSDEEWCQIDEPAAGCVMAKYLEFDGGGLLDDAAGIKAAP